MELHLFFIFAAIALASAINLVLQSRAVYSALSLIVCLGAISALYFLLGAQFVAIVQVIIYAGAIMVLFIFVIMLLDPQAEVLQINKARYVPLASIPLAAAMAFFGLRAARSFATVSVISNRQAAIGPGGNTEALGRLLFTEYLLAFEVTSVLILAGIIGAVVLAKRKL